MCIGILNNKKTLSKKHLKNSWENNDDGAGLLWVEKGKLKTFKELNSFIVFYHKYLEIRSKIKTPIVLHFRIGTHGKKNVDNLHPFICSEHVGFVHNGIISGWGNVLISDTNEFNLTILSKLPKGFEQNEATLFLIQETIGYSKLIFLNTNNEVSIVGEEKGSWSGDDWFSNDSYKELNSYVYYGNIKKDKNTVHTNLVSQEKQDYSEKTWWDEESRWSGSWDEYHTKNKAISITVEKEVTKVIDTCDTCLVISEVNVLDRGFTKICDSCLVTYADHY